jgi:hypothetical protein
VAPAAIPLCELSPPVYFSKPRVPLGGLGKTRRAGDGDGEGDGLCARSAVEEPAKQNSTNTNSLSRNEQPADFTFGIECSSSSSHGFSSLNQ